MSIFRPVLPPCFRIESGFKGDGTKILKGMADPTRFELMTSAFGETA
jgi:hypothetical protein